MLPATGVAPGLHNATNMFNHSYDKALQKYSEDCADDTSMMTVISPLDGTRVNMAHSSFVDDVCSTAASYDKTQMSKLAQNMSNKLTASFVRRGFRQTAGKATMVAKTFGDGSHGAMQIIARDHPG